MLTQQILKGFELTRNFELDGRWIVDWNLMYKGTHSSARQTHSPRSR
jgi:hypothetical protein